MNNAQSPTVREVVRESFFATHAGRSTDDVVIDDALNANFIAACFRVLPSVSAFEFNWALYNLRKQPPGLGAVATAKRRDNHDDYIHAAEITARYMEDKHKQTIDQVLC